MSLREIRKKIDRIDLEILDLLNERSELALRTKKIKPAVPDPVREKEILSKVRSYAAGSSLLSGAFVEKLWSVIFQESRRLQRRHAESGGKSWRRLRR